MDEAPFSEILKRKRAEYFVSQNEVAAASGISREYLNRIESGRLNPSDDVKTKILDALERFNPEDALTLLIDYVRIRFVTDDPEYVICNILQLKSDFFNHEDYGFYSYAEHYYFGDIFVLSSPDIEKGVLLELKGRGCRQFESYLTAQSRSWYDFFMDCLDEGAFIKRLDLAINDMHGLLDIPELTRKCEREECVSVFRSFKSYRAGELVKKDEKDGMGNTLYIGSMSSDVYFCIYEKDYEQMIKLGIPIDENPIKNRFEIRLRNDRAKMALIDLLTFHDVDVTAFGIINRYIRFADRDDSLRRCEWPTSECWNWFVKDRRDKLKLTMQPMPYSIERTKHWIEHQVAPTLKMLQRIDTIQDSRELDGMIDRAELSDKQKKILKQVQSRASDIVCEKGYIRGFERTADGETPFIN